MIHHMDLHHDVLGRIHTILKQDDYFRTLKELPAIDVYDDIQLFPKLFDTPAVIERITSKANLIKNNSTEVGCTHSHGHLYHQLQVLFLDHAQHSDLSCLLHHHLHWKRPNHIRHHRARNPCQAVQYHVDREHPLLLHHSHQHNQMIAPPASLLRPQCPSLQKRRYENHSMKESRIAENKQQCPQLLPKTVDSASDVNSWVT